MYEPDDDYDPYDDYEDRIRFADPGSGSALRAGVRDQMCPTCHGKNRLTREDVALGYQCDECANALERGIDGPWYGDDDDDEGD
jgi:hypothetical protein